LRRCFEIGVWVCLIDYRSAERIGEPFCVGSIRVAAASPGV
jgi:hypothetical protein